MPAAVAGARAPPRRPAQVGGWRLRALGFGFADDYLGVPKDRLNDDDGFVARLRLWAELAGGGGETLRLEASQQLITERDGLDRVDLGRLAATYARSSELARGWTLTLGWTAGVEVIGNLGGSIMQNWAHHDLFVGRHLTGVGNKQLQYRYPDHLDVVPIVGGLATVARPLLGPLWLRLGLEAEGGVGTGLLGEAHPFAAAALVTRYVELELKESGGIYGTSIASLKMPGGYVTGRFQGQLSAQLVLRSPRPFPAFLLVGLDWNRGDSRQRVGEIAIGASF